jgi:hypothetical protein
MAEPAQNTERGWCSRLLAAGLSILPVEPRDKRPLRAVLPEDEDGKRVWGCWTKLPPDPEIVDYWLRKRPDLNLGIITGAVSGGLQTFDIDDGLFARWLESRIDSLGALSGTWVVKTGSGKLHVHLRSDASLGPGEHKLSDERDGRKLADIRDEGAYVVGPPSFVVTPTNPQGGYYRTLRGSPESIIHVADGVKVWRALAAAYAMNGHAQPQAAPEVHAAVSYRSRAIQPPAEGPEAARLATMIKKLQSMKAKRAITDGNPTWPGWDGKDWSDLDWRVVKETLQAGGWDWSDADFEAVWATFPIGEHCYRNASRPQHGTAYLLGYTLPKARAEYEQERAAAGTARGGNFEISSVRLVKYEEPLYEVMIERTDTVPHKAFPVTISHAEIGNERTFILSVFHQTQWIPQLQHIHTTPNGYRQFLGVLGSITEVVAPPEGATEAGQLWAIVRRAILDRMQNRTSIPEKASDIRFGWWEKETAFVSSSALMAHLRQEMRSPPKPPAVWSLLEAKGAKARHRRIAGTLEQFWEIRAAILA